MFSSSVRRVASTALPIPTASSFSNSAQRSAASQALSYRSHQRRHSSSKPSSPADGSKGVSDGQGVAAAAGRSASKPSSPADGSKGVSDDQGVAAAPAHAQPKDEKDEKGEKKPAQSSKKKAKDGATSGKGKDESIQNLPCVPSTDHISPESTYFSSNGLEDMF